MTPNKAVGPSSKLLPLKKGQLDVLSGAYMSNAKAPEVKAKARISAVPLSRAKASAPDPVPVPYPRSRAAAAPKKSAFVGKQSDGLSSILYQGSRFNNQKKF